MSQNRVGRTIVAFTVLAGAWGAFSAARAQASGTLQSSVTVIDDAVNRALAAELPAYLSATEADASLRPGSIQRPDRGAVLDAGHVRAIVRDEPGERRARHVRIDVIYLQ